MLQDTADTEDSHPRQDTQEKTHASTHGRHLTQPLKTRQTSEDTCFKTRQTLKAATQDKTDRQAAAGGGEKGGGGGEERRKEGEGGMQARRCDRKKRAAVRQGTRRCSAETSCQLAALRLSICGYFTCAPIWAYHKRAFLKLCRCVPIFESKSIPKTCPTLKAREREGARDWERERGGE